MKNSDGCRQQMSENQILEIEAGRSERHYWNDLWRYRELFYFLAWRDILVRYKQTSLGIAWALIRPLLTMIVFTIIFSKLARLPSGNIPYPLLVLAAMLPWQFFASAITESGNSLIGNANMISKVYFPRMVIPVSSVIVSFVDFLISGVIILAMMLWYGFSPDWRLLAIMPLMVLVFATALGIGFWISALTVKYRDFRYISPFMVQLGLYVSPVGFSSDIVPEQWRLLYSLNPMVGIIDGFRWALLAREAPLNWASLLVSIVLTVILLISGTMYFRKTERRFADLI